MELLAEQIRQNIQQVQLEQFEKQLTHNQDLPNIDNSQMFSQQVTEGNEAAQ